MSTVTLQQFGSDLATFLALVRRGETVAITDGGRVVAKLAPVPDVIAEHAVVRLRMDRTDDGLVAGATGAVVHVYEGGEDYEVEFIVSGRSKLVTVAGSELEVITDA